jgi:pyruvate dehydrogenase kinase 2/3/4
MTAHDLWGWAARTPTPLRLADMYQYAANPDFRIPNAVFLHTELPIRVAQRAVDLLTLPFGLSEAPPIRAVASTYIRYLHTILATPPPQTRAQEAHFTDVLQSLVLDRASIPQAIAQGLGIWKAHTTAASTTEDDHAARYHEMEEALYRFFTARVGLRFLTEHHVLSSQRNTAASDALRSSTLTRGLEPDAADTVDTVGCIQAHVDLAKEVRRVVAVVQEQFEQSGAQRVPPVEIVDCPSSCTDDDGFTYVPHHLHYMLLELLKNSVRATLREYDLHEELPPIRIVLVKGAEDVTIKVADKAGGIPRSRMAQIWQFCHSTVVDDDGHSGRPPSDASGTQLRGFGLPICRIYARYFGGELTLKSVEGYGLDAYLHLPRLGKSGEHLPPRVRASPGELDSLPTGWAGRTASTSSTSSTSSSSVGTASGSSTTQRHYSSAVALEQAWDRQEDVIRKRLRALFR